MRELYQILEAAQKRKMMVRFSMFPGGHVSLGVYNNVGQSKQYLYESKDGNIAEIETRVKKDLGHLITPVITLPPLPPLPRL